MLKIGQYFRWISSRYYSSSVKPAWCSKLPRSQYSKLERLDHPSQSWFQIYRIRPNVFAIYEPYHWEESISYLVLGSQKSLLIDTGMGIGNIEEAQNELQPGMIWEKHLPKDFIHQNYRIHPFEINNYVEEGDRINLGPEHNLEVIFTPGHAPDSISLLDEKQRLLFVGDTFYEGPILLYRPETNLDDYLCSLEKLAKLAAKFDLILPGHNTPNVEPSLLIKAAKAMRDVMNRKIIGKKTDDGKYDEYVLDEFSFVIDEFKTR